MGCTYQLLQVSRAQILRQIATADAECHRLHRGLAAEITHEHHAFCHLTPFAGCSSLRVVVDGHNDVNRCTPSPVIIDDVASPTRRSPGAVALRPWLGRLQPKRAPACAGVPGWPLGTAPQTEAHSTSRTQKTPRPRLT